MSTSSGEFSYLFYKAKGNQPCYSISTVVNQEDATLNTSYFIGVDWVVDRKFAIYVAPKLNNKPEENVVQLGLSNIKETDYLKMLFSCLKHPDVAKEIEELFEIRWDKPEIEINQKQDLLTPLLVIHFLMLVKEIVRKGLKRSYYVVQRNLDSKVKGKLLVSETIKQCIVKSKGLNTYCSFEEFGLNGVENRLIKMALLFVQKYLPVYFSFGSETYLRDLINYINPAFVTVTGEVQLEEVKHSKANIFYKEYGDAIKLSKLILGRYGFNISNVEKETISTPPFWIDMSKLFELYVLGLLKDRFQNQVEYHFTHYGNELDFILKSDHYRLVIDAKYKPKYINGMNNEDIRQISGYARLRKVYDFLDLRYPTSIDCLIIYPDQEKGYTNLEDVDLCESEISTYNGVFKIGVKLPTIKHS